jgi:hypothetical protein
MRAFGLLCLLLGSFILGLPLFNQLAHTHFRFDGSQMLSGLLLALGVITVVLTRDAA